MANIEYNSYHYQSYSQPSAQQHGGYAAPVPTGASQNTRQHYQQPATVTTQATDYLPTSSYAAPSYSTQNTGTYGSGQNIAWTGSSSYGASKETTRDAAEVLRNMSSTSSYGSNAVPAAGRNGFAATDTTSTATARYTPSPAQQQSLARPRQQSHTSHSYAQVQAPQQTHSPQQSHAQTQLRSQQPHQAHSHAPQNHLHHQPQPQSQAFPRSMNTVRNQPAAPNRDVTSPPMATAYPAQRAQKAYNHQPQRTASPGQVQSSTRPSPGTAQTATRGTETPTQHVDYRQRQLPNVDAPRSTPTSAVPAASSSYNYSDAQTAAPAAVAPPAAPTAVPDEYNQGSVTVDPMAVYNSYTEWEKKRAARAEEERKAETLRLHEDKEKEERKKAQEEERARQAAHPPAQDPAPSDTTDAAANSLEAEARAIMAKMRELNSKNPALLARIREEERRAKAPKSPAPQNKAAPQPANAQPDSAPAAPPPVPPAPVQRPKAPPKQVPQTQPIRPPVQAPLVPLQVSNPRPQAATANNIWPKHKQAQAAHAVAQNVLALNPGRQLTVDTIITILAGNPSYIELCEKLEAMSLKLDRAALAKALLAAIPDFNPPARSQAGAQPRHPAHPSQNATAPPAVLAQQESMASAVQGLHYAPAHDMMNGSRYPPFPDGTREGSDSPAPVAQMIPTKEEPKPPANKEAAARKRTFEDLIDLTAVSDEDLEPLPKKQNIAATYRSPCEPPCPSYGNGVPSVKKNFPVPEIPSQSLPQSKAPAPVPISLNNLKGKTIVQPLDKTKALRRNGYNIATIARDVLLACGRHPEERQLNGHLEILLSTLPQVSQTSDLSTLRWDMIDPGEPPKGYYKDSSQTVAEDADDEEDSDDEEDREQQWTGPAKSSSQGVGGAGTGTGPTLAGQDLPPPVNPFQPAKKRGRGRPPRHSYPIDATTSAATATPRQQKSSDTQMNVTPPRTTAGSVGYSAFRAATKYGPDGKPLPKKRGRPVGWRKAIHGSPAAQARPPANGHTGANRNHTPAQPTSMRNVRSADQDMTIRSSSLATSNESPRQPSFKCKWQHCKADLHNLETLKKHVHKVHRKETLQGSLECLWGDCRLQTSSVHPTIGIATEKHTRFSFNDEAQWREHLQVRHFSPLAWELGDGPASGHSDAHGSDHYLGDAQGRRVTPRVSVDPTRFTGPSSGRGATAGSGAMPSPRPRGRPPKNPEEREARGTLDQLVAQKKRMGGPGIDRGGATLVNDKRRRGLLDDDQTEEQYVDADT